MQIEPDELLTTDENSGDSSLRQGKLMVSKKKYKPVRNNKLFITF